jgi:PiT family inorganic phosphate transporter/sodium-dependent phosphate transporter
VELFLIIFVLAAGFYMAWNIGANDVSNAMGTSVGSGALTLFKAVIIAGILEFAGAFFLGGHVSETIQRGIVDPTFFAETARSSRRNSHGFSMRSQQSGRSTCVPHHTSCSKMPYW